MAGTTLGVGMMANTDAAACVRIREDNGRIYVGDSDRAYLVETGWTMFVDVRRLRYVENYEHEDGNRLKKSIIGRMSCGQDQLGVLGAASMRLRRGEEADLQICPTEDLWISKNQVSRTGQVSASAHEYDWTLEIDWYGTFFGMMALPEDVFNAIANRVLAGQVTSLMVFTKGGLWVSLGDSMAPERVPMTRYLRPGNGGQTDRPEGALCQVTDLHVRCGEPAPEEPPEPSEDDERPDERLTVRDFIASTGTLVAAVTTVAAGNVVISRLLITIPPLLIAIFGALSYIAFWK